MNNTAALIIAQDCASNALTLRAYAFLLAVDSPYVAEGRKPTAVDALFADSILRGETADVLDPGYLERLAKKADAISTAQAEAIASSVELAMAPAVLAMRGLASSNKGALPTNGLVPALLLQCWREFGWSWEAAMETPLATLLLILREANTQKGKAISFAQMDLIDAMQAETRRKAEEAAHGG